MGSFRIYKSHYDVQSVNIKHLQFITNAYLANHVQ